jgi:hypothetical protein
MDENNKKDDKNEKEIKYLLKISLISNSKNEKIKQQFLKAIKAKDLFDSSKIADMGVGLANLEYRTSKKYLFQFWSRSNNSRFEEMIPGLILGSLGIIYFYHIDDKIEEDRLKLIKNRITFKKHLLFVGYDSILPKKTELSDHNIRLIKK